MKTDTPYVLTEWEWFKLQLEIYALKDRGQYWVVAFNYPAPGKLECQIWCHTTQDSVDKKADKQKQLEFYENWVANQKFQIRRILQEIPVLKDEFSVDHDIKFRILYDYGMGSMTVCSFDESGVHWPEYDESEHSPKKQKKSSKQKSRKKEQE